jgi:peptide/nickel transport system substrate-binding protein
VMEKAQGSVGEERRKLWREVFRRVQEEIIPDVILFHMVAYCRVGKRINFKPTLITSNQIPLADITFR